MSGLPTINAVKHRCLGFVVVVVVFKLSNEFEMDQGHQTAINVYSLADLIRVHTVIMFSLMQYPKKYQHVLQSLNSTGKELG